ncbi:MAG: hypothetical protein P1P82_06965 [Bacteroidales bacterium]|nr:hypothetical protein [Bacteroidales bacterium]
MRNIFKYLLFGLALMMVVIAGCDTASQEVSPVISPDDYPVATFTTDFSADEITEGDSIVYTITTDKMIDRAITFHVTQKAGSVDDHDFTYEPAVLQPYTTEVELKIFFLAENLVEETEDISFEISPISMADKYLLNPSTEYPEHDLNIVNYNDPTLLTINFYWDDENDNDIAVWSDTDDYPQTLWSLGGATTAVPEMDMSIWLADPAGDYYVNIFDWGNPSFNYTFVFGLPDGTMQTVEGFFDVDNLDQYTLDVAYDAYDTYRVIKVVNSGTSFTITKISNS